MRGTRRRRVGLIATLMIFFGVTATSSEAQDQVVLQLRWDHQAQFAGYYAALWQGFYEAAGIEVEIRSAFGPEGRLEAINEVVEGRADFGIGGADVMIAANNGSPVLIASPVFQHSGFGIVSRLDSRISGPADLIG
ncbi:MAG: ABC transporter substrate-binding protein, partial [Alphaproteobacteria bacterium]|nr:ABC transporter substrate-binding protein [Alphaproteobacteria bacterium]